MNDRLSSMNSDTDTDAFMHISAEQHMQDNMTAGMAIVVTGTAKRFVIRK